MRRGFFICQGGGGRGNILAMQPLRVSDSSFSVSSASLRPQTGLRPVPTGESPSPLFRTSDGRSFEVPVDGTPLSLGRRSSNGVPMDHPKVSRHHAELRLKDGKLMVRDSGSSYGTYLDGRKLEARGWVPVPADGQIMLGLGGPTLQFGEGSDSVQLQSAAPPVVMRPVVTAEKPVLQSPPSVLREDGPAAATPDPSPIDVSQANLTRRTVGWSGEGPHQALIQRGVQAMDRFAPGYRDKLDALLEQAHDPQTAYRLDQLLNEQMAVYTQNGKLMNLPLAMVESKMGAPALEKRQQLETRVDAIQEEVGSIEKAHYDQQHSNKLRAEELAASLLRRLREHNSGGTNAGSQARFDEAAVKKLADKGLKPDQVRAWVNDFYHQTGLPVPDKIQFTYLDGRPRYIDATGAINIGDYFDKRICMHELAHPVEFRNPALSQANKAWVKARCQASGFEPESPEKLQKLCPEGKYGPEELAQRDHFTNPYVGKVYADAATEVLSTGLEHFTDGKKLVQLYQQDPEQFFLVLGALETLKSSQA